MRQLKRTSAFPWRRSTLISATSLTNRMCRAPAQAECFVTGQRERLAQQRVSSGDGDARVRIDRREVFERCGRKARVAAHELNERAQESHRITRPVQEARPSKPWRLHAHN